MSIYYNNTEAKSIKTPNVYNKQSINPNSHVLDDMNIVANNILRDLQDLENAVENLKYEYGGEYSYMGDIDNLKNSIIDNEQNIKNVIYSIIPKIMSLKENKEQNMEELVEDVNNNKNDLKGVL